MMVWRTQILVETRERLVCRRRSKKRQQVTDSVVTVLRPPCAPVSDAREWFVCASVSGANA